MKAQLGLVHHDIAKAKYTPGGLTVDGQAVYADHCLKTGEILRVFISEKMSETTVPEEGPLFVLYEDADVLAVDKPAGLVVHPSHGHYRDSLANYVAWHFLQEHEEHEIRTVGRLDKDTSGVMLYGKNRSAVSKLMDQSADGRRIKLYLALAKGTFEPESDVINAPIGRVLPGSTKRCVREDGDPAVTRYRRLRQYDGYALLAVTIKTGRTHQIRVHLSSIGHPLLGDELYGCKESGGFSTQPSASGIVHDTVYARDGVPITRAALHAYRTEFFQPFTGEKITCTSPMPLDMQAFCRDFDPQSVL